MLKLRKSLYLKPLSSTFVRQVALKYCATLSPAKSCTEAFKSSKRAANSASTSPDINRNWNRKT
jgi:hypothetical protein